MRYIDVCHKATYVWSGIATIVLHIASAFHQCTTHILSSLIARRTIWNFSSISIHHFPRSLDEVMLMRLKSSDIKYSDKFNNVEKVGCLESIPKRAQPSTAHVKHVVAHLHIALIT